LLAGRHGTVRAGAVVFPLDTRAIRRGAAVGAEVATTARLLHLLPISPTAVLMVSPGVGVNDLLDEMINVSCGMLDARADATLTVGVACPRPVQPGTAGGMSMYNVGVEALPEAILESVAVGRRCGLVTDGGACVLLLQRFAAPTASALVYVQPDRAQPVRIDGRWGLIEAEPTELSSDTFEVPAEDEVRERLGAKPTASVTAPGGTRTVSLPESWHHRHSLSRQAVHRLATMARESATAAGRALSLDVAMFDDEPVVLRCRPCMWT
jgi:hypothetical protein